MARDRLGRARARPGPDGLGEDPRRLPLRHRPAERVAGRGAAAALRLAVEGAQLRRRAEPARAARRPPLRAPGRRPHRRHRRARAAAAAALAARRPDHDARVAVPAAHLAGARDPPLGRDADPRRGPRRRRQQARRPSRALGGAARAAARAAAAAGGALGDAATAGGDRPLRLGRQADPARRRRPTQGARPRGGRARRGHARAAVDRLALLPGAGRRAGDGLGHRAELAVDLALDLPGDRPARRAAPVDDRLRQQPPSGRAAGAAPERARREGDRLGPPRLARPRAADARRGGPEGGADPLPRRHLLARARDRHGRRRPRDPGRVAEVGRARAAADRPLRAHARRRREGPHLPEVPLRPARERRRRAGDSGGRDRGDADPAQPARRARAAGGRDRGRRGDRRRRPARSRHPRLPVRRPLPRAARERARHAGRPLPLGRVRGAAAADRLGPDGGGDPRPGGRAPARGHERGHDPGPRSLRRPPRRRRRPRRRARRGDGLRGPRRPDLPARRLDLADRGDHAGPRARLAGARRARARCRSGRGRASAARTSWGRRSGAPRASSPRSPSRRRSPG